MNTLNIIALILVILIILVSLITILFKCHNERLESIVKNLDKDIDITVFEETKKKKGIGSLLKWILPLLIIFMIIYIILYHQ